MITEKQLEKKLCREVEKLGGKAIKFYSQFYRGLPDRLILMPGGRAWFVELKRPGGHLTPLQLKVRDWLSKLGFRHLTVDSEFTLKQLIRILKAQQQENEI